MFFVSDTGIGIAKDALINVFNYFVKEDRMMTRPNEGSGLGLSISKGIVELLGGVLTLESEMGKGSVLSFSLPVHEIVRKRPLFSVANSTSLRKRLSSILIAEDDEANFLYLKTLLNQNTKAEIIYAVNGREAIEKFKINRSVDIILMDMKMPEVDGFEATRRIKSIDPSIPVIAVTAYAMLGDEKRIRDAGCDEYLTKPINKKTLLEKMSRFVVI
jgi:CheY-like chemotaxis protein